MLTVSASGTSVLDDMRNRDGMVVLPAKFHGIVGADLITDQAAFIKLPGQTFLTDNPGRADLGPYAVRRIHAPDGLGGTGPGTFMAAGIAKAPPGRHRR